MLSIQKNILKKHVLALSGIMPPRNYLNSTSLNQAAGYIESVFRELPLRVERQTYSIGKREYYNILAHWGENPRRIIVGAHYDVFGKSPGADDNASAIAALLEIARRISTLNVTSEVGFDFVAYTLEEPPFFGKPQMGSAVHVQELKKSNITVEFMMCLEMLGYFTNKPDSQRYPAADMAGKYPNQGNFLAIVSNKSSAAICETMHSRLKAIGLIPVEKIIGLDSNLELGLSDHRNFWEEGFPAIMATDTAFYRNPNYHKASDLPATLNYTQMTLAVEALSQVLVNWQS